MFERKKFEGAEDQRSAESKTDILMQREEVIAALDEMIADEQRSRTTEEIDALKAERERLQGELDQQK